MGASLSRTRRMRWLAVTSLLVGLLLAPGAAIAVQPVIDTVAGGGQFDGQQATAVDLQPYGVTTDKNGEVYLSDQSSHRVFRIDPQTGIVTTVAGNGLRGTAGDGGSAVAAGLT